MESIEKKPRSSFFFALQPFLSVQIGCFFLDEYPITMSPINPIKSVAVIGAGPSGAIAVDALMQEKVFDVVRVFERQEKAGGCWYNSLPLAPLKGSFSQAQGIAR